MVCFIFEVDHCNISLSTITPMLQHTGMEVFDDSNQCRISYTITDIGYLKIQDTRYPIFLKIVRYETTLTETKH